MVLGILKFLSILSTVYMILPTSFQQKWCLVSRGGHEFREHKGHQVGQAWASEW